MQSQNQLNLFKQLSIREITNTVRQSYLGVFWLLFAPLLSLGIYFVVFGVLFGGSFSKSHPETSFQYAIGVYIGLSTVMFFNESISRASNLIRSNANLVKKVVFPLYLLPFVQTTGVGFKFFINFLLWFSLGIFFASSLSSTSFYLLLTLTPLPFLVAGATMIISSISVYFPDIQHITAPITQIVFWSSGVFYGAEKLSLVPTLWEIIKWNPLFQINEITRNLIIWKITPEIGQLCYIFGTSLLVFTFGLAIYNKLKENFGDFV